MASRAKLSKGILDMKFMKRSKEKVDKETEEALDRETYGFSEEKSSIETNFIIEPSYFLCEELIEGRLSFRGMNPEIEKIMELETLKKEEADTNDIKKEVSDEEMTHYYQNVAKTMSRKFDRFKKRKFEGDKPTNSKRKFVKCEDSD